MWFVSTFLTRYTFLSSFKITATENEVTFKVSGYGHGVGMSQYGADFMARQGSTYEEILKHYYKNVTVE